jgi:hypothetical protein
MVRGATAVSAVRLLQWLLLGGHYYTAAKVLTQFVMLSEAKHLLFW